MTYKGAGFKVSKVGDSYIFYTVMFGFDQQNSFLDTKIKSLITALRSPIVYACLCRMNLHDRLGIVFAKARQNWRAFAYVMQVWRGYECALICIIA